MNLNKSLPTLIIGLASALSAQHALGQTLLDDQFTDNDRTNQSLTTSAKWTVGGVVASGAAAGGVYQVNAGLNGNQNRNFETTAYFTDSGTITLANIGDKLTLTFDATFTLRGSAADNALRFGLFNSQGTRVTADNTTANGADAAFNNDLGYSLWANGLQSGDTVLYERTGTDDTLMASSANTQIGTGGTNSSLLNGTSTSASFSLERTASGLLITSSIGGGTVSFTDTTVSTYSFDMIQIFGAGSTFSDNGSNSGNIVLDNVQVVLVPEPTAFAMLLGSLGIVTIFRRRRA